MILVRADLLIETFELENKITVDEVRCSSSF